MPLTKSRKQSLVTELQDKIAKAKGVYLLDFTNLKTQFELQIRRKLKQLGAEYRVTKNTLLRIALSNSKLSIPENGSLAGSTALVLSYDDPLKPLSAILEVMKQGDGIPSLKSAFLEKDYFTKAELKPFEKFNSRAEIVAETIGVLQGLLVSLVGVLSALPGATVGTLEAIIEKKTSGGAS